MGKQELGGTVTQCAVRKTAEETGVTVEVTGLLGSSYTPASLVSVSSMLVPASTLARSVIGRRKGRECPAEAVACSRDRGVFGVLAAGQMEAGSRCG
jgi:ADP-ribose pyrophosphatase YjhB (NUDIX family)